MVYVLLLLFHFMASSLPVHGNGGTRAEAQDFGFPKKGQRYLDNCFTTSLNFQKNGQRYLDNCGTGVRWTPMKLMLCYVALHLLWHGASLVYLYIGSTIAVLWLADAQGSLSCMVWRPTACKKNHCPIACKSNTLAHRMFKE